MLEALLERARRHAQAAEVFWVSSQDTPVHFEANRLKRVETRESSGVALRLIKDGRLGFSSTTHLGELDTLVAHAVELAAFGVPALLEFPPPQPYTPVPVYDPQTEAFPLEEMVRLGQGLLEALRPRWPEMLWDCHITKSVSTVRLLNSSGCAVEYTRTAFSISVQGTRVAEGDMLLVWDGESSCRPITETAPLLARLEEKLTWAQRVAPAPRGRVPVVFTPRGVAGVLLRPLLVGFNGRTVAQGASPLVGKLGEQLLDRRLTIWDDPSLPYVPGSRMCDDEGVPARPLPLVQEGVITNFLFDLQTAAQVGAHTTGSASRSISTPPNPATSVVVIQEGETALESLIADLKEGLIVEGVLGAGQGNVLGGDFSANVLLGYGIRDGQVVGRVKDTVISGNVYTALRELLALGSEAQWVGGFLRTPALGCTSVTVSSKM